MNKINTSPSLQRFERIFTEQVKLDKVTMQRHKIFGIVAVVAAVAFTAAMIAATPVITLIAGGTLLATTAAIVTSLALLVLASCAIGFAINYYAKHAELKDNHNLHFLISGSFNLDEKTPSLINSLIRYGLVSDKVAGKLKDFQKKFDDSQFFKRGIWDKYPHIIDEKQKKIAAEKLNARDLLKAEWVSHFSMIQNDIPFPPLEEGRKIRPLLFGVRLKALNMCDIESARKAARSLSMRP